MTDSKMKMVSIVALIALAILSGFLLIDRSQIKSSLEAKDVQFQYTHRVPESRIRCTKNPY